MLVLRRLAVIVAVAVTLAACGKDKATISENPQAALGVAAKRTADGKTVQMTLDATAGSIKVVTGTGAYDFKSSTGRFKLSGALLSDFDVVITPDKLYVATPNGPKKWRGLTQEELDKAGSGTILASLRSDIDPRETLRNLGTTTKNVQVVGEEKVRDTNTTHLRGDVDLSDEAIAKAPKDQQQSLRDSRDSLQAQSYPIDVWLDKQGRVRRLAYAVTAGEGAQRATTTVQFELFDFGKDPGIVIPNPADVQNGPPASG
jgi:hypothetical protein